MISLRRITAALVIAVAISACSSVDYSGQVLSSGLNPASNGFAFPNFGSSASPEVFDEADIVEMFGASGCVDGVADPCVLTAEAAAWARMVNESRTSGHCEGLVVQAATRFVEGLTPVTGELTNGPDVTNAVIRAFATQFLPEAQRETAKWAGKSMRDVVNELARSLDEGDESYSLGLYTESGGHAVLPYEVQFFNKDIAQIRVYDSNWPGQVRVVDVDFRE